MHNITKFAKAVSGIGEGRFQFIRKVKAMEIISDGRKLQI